MFSRLFSKKIIFYCIVDVLQYICPFPLFMDLHTHIFCVFCGLVLLNNEQAYILEKMMMTRRYVLLHKIFLDWFLMMMVMLLLLFAW